MKNIKLGLFGFIILLTLTSCSLFSNLDIQKLNFKANELMKSGDIDGAIARLESINDLNSNFPQTHYNLGIAYHKKKNYEKALSEFNIASKLKPNFPDVYYTVGVIYEEMAINLVDEHEQKDNKNNQKKLKPEIKEKIVSYLNKSIESFKKYLDYSKNSSDFKDIQSKVEFLQNDLNKYTETKED